MMDPNLYKIYQKNSILNDNQSKIFHCQLSQLILDHNAMILEVLVSNVEYLTPNNFLSIVDVTMDFLIEVI